MFILKNPAGETLLMQNGDPFLYSSRDLAKAGKRLLDDKHKTTFTIVPF